MNIKLLSKNETMSEATTKINILLFGPSKTGKSTLVRTILNPNEGTRHAGFSDNSELKIYKILYSDNQNGRSYLLTIIDTPGIEEYLRIGSTFNHELNQELLAIEYINIICITTKAGFTNLEDNNTIKQFINLLPNQCSKCCLLILTHCDLYTSEKISEFEQAIKNDFRTKQLNSFCEQGIIKIGALDLDRIESFKSSEIEYQIKKVKLNEIEKYRLILIKQFISCSNEPPVIIQGPLFLQKFDEQPQQQSYQRSSTPIAHEFREQRQHRSLLEKYCCFCCLRWCAKSFSIGICVSVLYFIWNYFCCFNRTAATR